VVNDSGGALRWSVEQGRIEGSSTGSTVRVRWGNAPRGLLMVTAVSPVTGCSGKAIFQVWLSPGSTPRISPGSVTLCKGDTATLSADTGFVSWRWSDGVTTRVRRITTPGTFAVEAKDENGCAAVSDSITVTVNDPPAPSLIGEEQVCRGDTAYYISAPTAGNEYGWLISGGSILASPSPWFVYVAWNDGTRGKVILREKAGSCVGADTMLVEVGAGRKPDVFINGALRFCQGDSVILTAEDGFSDYRWSTGETSRSIAVRSSGAYIVRTSDGGDCPGWSDSVRVTSIPLPEKPVISRAGDVLNASPANAYQWYAADSLLPGETGRSLHLTRPGIYFVEAWDREGCSSISDPFDVTVLDADPAPMPRHPLISIYPEPHSGRFTFNIHMEKDTELTLRIRDALGRLIASDRCRTEDGKLTKVFRLDKMPSGIYLLEAEHGKGMERIKTMVRH